MIVFVTIVMCLFLFLLTLMACSIIEPFEEYDGHEGEFRAIICLTLLFTCACSIFTVTATLMEPYLPVEDTQNEEVAQE